MAKYTATLSGDFDRILSKVTDGIMNRSSSASLEDSWRADEGNSHCAVRVFERYSYMGNNRVSMSVTMYQEGTGPIRLCGITSGGSQAVFFKINTIGEETFLDTLKETVASLGY